MSSDSQMSGGDWPKDSEELLKTFWDAATFHAGAVEVAREYADELTEKADRAAGPTASVSRKFGIDAEIFKDMAEELIEVFALLSRRVRVTAEKARLNQLDNPNEVRRLQNRIRKIHRNLYIECLEALGKGVEEAKQMANQLREDPEQADRPEHLSELDDVIDDAEEILNRETDPEAAFESNNADPVDEDEDEESPSA